MMKDKRAECGCHVGCTTDPHDCENKCVWPLCLTKEEERDLLAELEEWF